MGFSTADRTFSFIASARPPLTGRERIRSGDHQRVNNTDGYGYNLLGTKHLASVTFCRRGELYDEYVDSTAFATIPPARGDARARRFPNKARFKSFGFMPKIRPDVVPGNSVWSAACATGPRSSRRAPPMSIINIVPVGLDVSTRQDE